MPANIQPIFPAAPAIGIATFTGATALTSRANIIGTTGLTPLTPVSTNGKRVDAITIKGKGTTVTSLVGIWLFNGTTSFLIDEIPVSAATPGGGTESFTVTRPYANLVLPPNHQLFVSQQVQTDVNVLAYGGDY